MLAEKRLERACRYVNDMWFPANPRLVERLKKKIAKGTLETDLDLVLNEVRSDFSLFLYCLKELTHLIQFEDEPAPLFENPFDFIRWAGLERLRTILGGANASLSQHNFDKIDDLQRLRLEELSVSTTTTELLAKQSELDPDQGFSAALLRQLGFTLIAWNYPQVYQQAFARLSTKTTLDEEINKVLGFSPTLLATTLVRTWHISPALSLAVEYDDNSLDYNDGVEIEVEAIGRSLATLCRVGECLARANDPEHYPTARKDWESARIAIQSQLGADGLQTIVEAAKENSQNYTRSVRGFFMAGSILTSPEFGPAIESKRAHYSNPYISECSHAVAVRLRSLYEALNREVSPEITLQMLVREVIPASAFLSGLVYTVDPVTSLLTPLLRIGRTELRSLDAVPSSNPGESDDLVTLAFQAKDALLSREFDEQPDGKKRCAYAGYFGVSQRLGVVYLEALSDRLPAGELIYRTDFMALVYALNDSLRLK